MIYYGKEVFDAAKMQEYVKWEQFKQSPTLLPYLGKAFEFVGGLLLGLGFLTRIGALLIMGTMLCIAFLVGKGRIWYEEQYPFLFALLAFLFLFTGPGAWSVDRLVFGKEPTV